MINQRRQIRHPWSLPHTAWYSLNWQWLKHAFAVEPPEATVMTVEQQAIVERLCQTVEARGMQLPTVLFLESVRPMNYLTAQSMHFFTPFVAALAEPAAYQAFAEFLERPGAIEILCHRLEHKVFPSHAVLHPQQAKKE